MLFLFGVVCCFFSVYNFFMFFGLIDGTFEQILSQYGYYAIFLFALIEGEVALFTAGMFAYSNILYLPKVILVAFSGTVLSEQILFLIGYKYGMLIVNKFEFIKNKSYKIFEFIKKYDNAFIFSFRFIYGIRTISPIVIGAAGVSFPKFAILNVLAAILWAVVIASSGYLSSMFLKNVLHCSYNGPTFILIVSIFITSLITGIIILLSKKKK